jgi:soluble cytochrome b562
MDEYNYDEVWTEVIKFVLELHQHPKYKPKTIKDAKDMLEFIPAIRNIINTIDDTDKYLEMVIMADELEESLQKELKELQDERYDVNKY